MNLGTELEFQSFVLLRLGERKFAIAADDVSELLQPGRIHRFPHQTPHVEGVLLRRGRIVPVCDIAPALVGDPIPRRFYLVAARFYASAKEWVALPVSGECELITAEMTVASGEHPPHVAGWLSHEGEMIEVLNLDGLVPGPTPAGRGATLTKEGRQ